MKRILAVAALLSLATPVALQAQENERKVGAFHLVPVWDLINGTDLSMVATVPLDPAPDQTRFLAWRCEDDDLRVAYRWSKYFGGDDDDDVVVVWRFDSESPSGTTYWRLGDDNEAAWLSPGRTEAFTTAARRASKVMLRVTDPLDDETITHTFDLAGLEEALDFLSCTD